MKVTVFDKCYETDRQGRIVELDEVLELIKTGGKSHKANIEKLRAAPEEEWSAIKRDLPGVCFAGEFTIGIQLHDKNSGRSWLSYRTDESLTTHSCVVPVDIDDVENVQDSIETLINDPYIFAVWRSPSATGIHALVRIGDGNRHRKHYTALIGYFKDNYDVDIDTTCRNESRILFISYDPNIFINNSAKIFYDVKEEESKKGAVVSGDGFIDYKKLEVAAKMIRKAEYGMKHKMVLNASNLLGGYVAVNKMDYEIAKAILSHEVVNAGMNDLPIKVRAIEDGLRYGMTRPITEVEREWQEAMQEFNVMEEELTFLTDKEDDDDYIRKFMNGLIPPGKPFGYHDLDEYLLLKEAEFYSSLAHANVGKTTMNLWWIFLASVKFGWNWLMYLGENKAAAAKITLMQFYIGKKIQTFSQEEYRIARAFVNEYFNFFATTKLYNYQEILEGTDKFMNFKSLKGLFIDPFNSLKPIVRYGGSRYDYTLEAYNEFRLFPVRTGASLFLSAHTNTEAQRKRDAKGNQVMPIASDAEGGSALNNASDNFIVYHRKTKSPDEWMFTDVDVYKVRNRLTGGQPTPNGNPVRLRMNKGIEFVDIHNSLPFERIWLPDYEPAKPYTSPLVNYDQAPF